MVENNWNVGGIVRIDLRTTMLDNQKIINHYYLLENGHIYTNQKIVDNPINMIVCLYKQ